MGNPLYERACEDGTWKEEALRRLPQLQKLDGNPVVRSEEDGEQAEGESNNQMN